MTRDAAADVKKGFDRLIRRLDQIFRLLIALFAASLMLMFTIVGPSAEFEGAPPPAQSKNEGG